MAKKFKVYEEKDKSANLKIIIFIAVLLVIGYFVYLGYILMNYDKNDYGSKNIVLDMEWFYSYQDGKIVNKESFDMSNDNTIYNVKIDNEKKGKYSLERKDTGSIYFVKDKEKLELNPGSSLIATTDNIEVLDYEMVSLTSVDFKIGELLNNKGIVIDNDNLSLNYKVIVDLDNDDIDEEIYVIGDNSFSIVYVLDNDNVNIILEDYLSGMDYVQNNLKCIMDIDNDDKYELVISSSDMDSSNYTFWKLNEGKYINMMEQDDE